MEIKQLRRQMHYFRYYAIFSSLFIMVLLFSSFRTEKDTISKVLRAEKIEIVEKDGKVKLSLFNKDNLPPAIIDGKKLPRQGGDESGLMFYNAEGEECGGLIYTGATSNGKINSSASLSFDRYKQDQVVQLFNTHDGPNIEKGLKIFDRPDYSIVKTLAMIDSVRQHIPEQSRQNEVLSELGKQGKFGVNRLFVGQQKRETGMKIFACFHHHKLSCPYML